MKVERITAFLELLDADEGDTILIIKENKFRFDEVEGLLAMKTHRREPYGEVKKGVL